MVSMPDFRNWFVDFHFHESPRRPLLRREMLCAIPPWFDGRICCLAGFRGETGDSGRGLGFGCLGEIRGFIAGSRRISRAVKGGVPDLISGLIMGDFDPLGVCPS